MRDTLKYQASSYAEHYAILQLPPNSSPEQIHAQYRRLAKVFHPDRNPGMQEWCEGQLKQLNEAYRVLMSEPKPHTPLPYEPVRVVWPNRSLSRFQPLARLPRAAQVVIAAGSVGLLFAFLMQPSHDMGQVIRKKNSALMADTLPMSPAGISFDPSKSSMTDLCETTCRDAGETITQAAALIAQVNSETWHVPNSLRVEKADQLEADELELVRLQSVAQIDLKELQTLTSGDMRTAQLTDLKRALYQMQQQRMIVSHELNAFPEE